MVKQMFDITNLLWISAGTAVLIFAFLHYSLSYKERTGKNPFSEE